MVIYHGDAARVLPCLDRVDLLLTDPPYGIGCDRAIHATKPSRPSTYVSPPKYAPGEWDSERPSPVMFAAMLSLSTDQIIWGGNYFADLLPPSRGWLFWDKRFENTTNFSHGELAWTSLSKPLQKFTLSSKAETRGGQLRVHPTQKPEEVMRWSLMQAPNGTTVLDPFMGSGTTLVACKRIGRSCIGIEIDERYCEIAAKRLSQSALPLELGATVDAVDPQGGITWD